MENVLLFAGWFNENMGGFGDLVGRYESSDAAREDLHQRIILDEWSFEWAHIVEGDPLAITWRWRNLYGWKRE